MSERRHPIPQMDELSDGFRALAEREAVPRSVWRRWFGGRKRAVGIGVGVVVLAGSAASATQWISLGDPERPSHPDAPRYQPGSRAPVLAVTAPDKAVGLPWGVAVFDSKSGESCAFSGQVRGSTLGIVRKGRFQRLTGPTSAVCRRLSRGQVAWALKTFTTNPRRAIVFGRVGAGVAKARLRIGSDSRSVEIGEGGAFLFVLDGNTVSEDVSVETLDADGLRPSVDP